MRLVGPAGLDAVRSGHDAQRGVVVALGDAVPAHAGMADIAVIIGRVAGYHGIGQLHQIARRNIGVAVIHPAVGRAEMALGHAKAAGGIVHQGHPIGDAAAGTLGQHHAAIVGRDAHDPLQQRIDADRLTILQKHPRAGAVPVAIGIGAFGEGLLGAQFALRHQLEGDIGGHRLGDGGGQKRLIGVVRIERAPRAQIHQQRHRSHADLARWRGCRRALGRGRLGQAQWAREQAGQSQQHGGYPIFSQARPFAAALATGGGMALSRHAGFAPRYSLRPWPSPAPPRLPPARHRARCEPATSAPTY